MSNLTRPGEPFRLPPAGELFEYSRWPLVDEDVLGIIDALVDEYDALEVARDHLGWFGVRWVKGHHWPIAWLQLVSEKNREILGPPPHLELPWQPPRIILWISYGALARVVDPTYGNLYAVLYHALRSLQEDDGELVIEPPEIQRFVGEDVDMADWLLRVDQFEHQLSLDGPLAGLTEDDGLGLAPSSDPDAMSAVSAVSALLQGTSPAVGVCIFERCGEVLEPLEQWSLDGVGPYCEAHYLRLRGEASE